MQPETKQKGIKFGLITTGAMIGIIFGMMFWFWVMNMDGILLVDYIDNKLGQSAYDYRSTAFRSDPFIKNVTKFCAPFEGETFVECVVMQVAPIYNSLNITERANYTFMPMEPTKTMEVGGVCRDVAVLYDAIFDRAGWTTRFEFDRPKHVYNYMFKDGVSCRLDLWEYHCFGGLD